jgi:imidazolonepropionase-like amidohydrolase
MPLLRAYQSSTRADALLVIQNARLFDGTHLLSDPRTLTARGGVITALAPSGRAGKPPDDATIVDGAGCTLLPGLIDAHAHVFGNALSTAIAYGVTTILDMFTESRFAAAMRAEQKAGKATNRATLYSAGTLATAPGGHGTEYGMTIPTLTRPDEAQKFVDDRIAEGSDYIKIIFDDGSAYGVKTPTLSKETVRALIEATHRRGKKAVVHISTLQDARTAIEAGADGLMHLFLDRMPDPDFGRLVAAKKAFVCPTLSVLHSVSGLKDDFPPPTECLSAQDEVVLRQSFPPSPNAPKRDYAAVEATVRMLKAARVRLLAGTDAPNPGTAHGASLHAELSRLVKAGLTPTEALAAATSNPADAFGLKDCGRIKVSSRADLLLVKGDPTKDIAATRNIVGIWKDGVRFDREAVIRGIAAAKANTTQRVPGAPVPAGAESGLISDFEASKDGKPTARFGAGWDVSTDTIAGGKSAATMTVEAGALKVTGMVAPGLPYAWSGVLFSPGAQPFAPVNLSAKKTLRFRAKADGASAGKPLRVMLFTQSSGQTPLMKVVTPGADWKEFRLPFADFGTDAHDLMGLVFCAGPEPGAFTFWLDDVRLD